MSLNTTCGKYHATDLLYDHAYKKKSSNLFVKVFFLFWNLKSTVTYIILILDLSEPSLFVCVY